MLRSLLGPLLFLRARGVGSTVLVFAALAGAACAKSSGNGSDAGPAPMGSLDRSPVKAPPPLRAPHPAAPPLPDLPALAAQEPPSTAPAKKSSDHPCGGVFSGVDVVPLVCSKAAVFFGKGAAGATPLVPDRLLHEAELALPAVVDHRKEGSEGPVRDQKSAPACTAFAIATAVDHALARWMVVKPAPVSVMQVWSRYKSPIETTSIESNLGLSLGAESDWPFDAARAVSWMDCPKEAPSGKKPTCGRPIDETPKSKVETHPLATLSYVQFVDVADPIAIKEKLAAGQDVVVTLVVPDSFAAKGATGARYVPHWKKPAAEDAGHAVVLSGYATLAHGTYFLVHNSWGAAWGDGGFAWLHEASLKQWGREALVVDAEPASGQNAPGKLPRARGLTTCPAGTVPDSIRGSCAPPCASGGPRHDGVCPVSGQCPRGMVNLTGACVVAAPSGSGRDASSGISWACGESGCAYTLPRSVDGACPGASCMISCPAPDFHVARAGGRLTCIE